MASPLQTFKIKIAKYCFGKIFVKVLMPYWCTTQCVRTQRSHAAELLLNYIRLDWTHVCFLWNKTLARTIHNEVIASENCLFIFEYYYTQMFVYYCREPSSCMILGSNKSYHSMKQSIILHENFDKPFAIAIAPLTLMENID